jgi:hypothetical protein
MPVMRKGAQVVDAHRHQFLGQRSPEDSVLEETGEKAREDGDDLKSHTY